MPVPWNDEVTATIDVGGDRQIITQGMLRLVVPLLAARAASEHAQILLSFPDRRSPPFRYEGSDIIGLAAELRIRESKIAAQERSR